MFIYLYIYIYMYTFFCIFFSTMVYHRTLNLVPCVTQWDLVVYPSVLCVSFRTGTAAVSEMHVVRDRTQAGDTSDFTAVAFLHLCVSLRPSRDDR